MSAAAIEAFVARTLLPALGISGRSFEIGPPPQAGTRSSLHLVRAESTPALLLRTFPHRAQAAQTADALRHLERVDLPAPRLVFKDLSRAARLMAGPEGPLPFVTVETWIEGIPHSAIEDAARARRAALQVARHLARFHRETCPRWGRPGRGRSGSFFSASLRLASRMARDLASRGRLTRDEAAGIAASLSGWRDGIERIGEYNLVHNDANRHNFIVSDSDDVVAVDLHRISYEPFPEEIVNALYHFCRKHEPPETFFLDAYFEIAGATARALFDETRRFYEPLHYLKKMHRRAQATTDHDDEKLGRWRDLVLGR